MSQGSDRFGNASMWDALIEVHSRTGNALRARAAVADMQAAGLPVGLFAHTGVVSAHCNSGDFEVRFLHSPLSEGRIASSCDQHNGLRMQSCMQVIDKCIIHLQYVVSREGGVQPI